MQLSSICHPEYLLRPSQIVRRLLVSARTFSASPVKAKLPWRFEVLVNPSEAIGRAVLHTGLFELVVTESIFRLLDEGECAIDVGANIGLMTAAMVAATGPTGRVLAFEPNEQIFEMLQQNVSAWGNSVRIHRQALSSRAGVSTLTLPRGFDQNTGIGTLERVDDGCPQVVETARLDALLPADCRNIGLLKLDVEGHEAQVLEGAEKFLLKGGIRDILFEEHRSFPHRTHSFLLARGYYLFRLARTLFRPILLPANTLNNDLSAPSYLATLQPERAIVRFKNLGWRALGDNARW